MTATHLVTGGSGYFGSLLVQRLRNRGFSVRIFDLNDADDRPSDVEFVQGDIRDMAAISRACEGIQVVHHNVAQVPLAKDIDLFWSVNEGGTRNMLEAAKKGGARKVVYTSSSAVFGVPDRNPVTTETQPNPREDYGRAKYAGEKLCHEYIGKGLDVSICRPRTIMGHGRLGIMQILFEWIREGKNVPVFGKGDNVYQFVHADDMADACILAGERATPGIYNVGAERFGTMREVLENLCAYAGTGSKVVGVPMAPAVKAMELTSKLGLSPLGAYHSLMYGQSMYFDVTKTKADLGWQPKFSNDEMFRDSYDWYLANRDKVLASHGPSHHRSAVKQGILRVVSWFL